MEIFQTNKTHCLRYFVNDSFFIQEPLSVLLLGTYDLIFHDTTYMYYIGTGFKIILVDEELLLTLHFR